MTMDKNGSTKGQGKNDRPTTLLHKQGSISYIPFQHAPRAERLFAPECACLSSLSRGVILCWGFLFLPGGTVKNDTNIQIKRAMLEEGWDSLPRFIMRMTEIGPSEKLAFQFILGRIRAFGGGRAFPSVDTIAANTALSEHTVRRSIAELKKVGLISFERRGYGLTHEYQLEAVPDWILEKYGEFQPGKKNIGENAQSVQIGRSDRPNWPLSQAKLDGDFDKKPSQVVDGETTSAKTMPAKESSLIESEEGTFQETSQKRDVSDLHSIGDLPRGAAKPQGNGTATSPVARPPSKEAQSNCALPTSSSGGSGMKMPGQEDEPKKKVKLRGLYDASKPVADWTCNDALGYFRQKYQEAFPKEGAPDLKLEKDGAAVKHRLMWLVREGLEIGMMKKVIDYIFDKWSSGLPTRLGWDGTRPSLALIESTRYFESVVREVQNGPNQKRLGKQFADDYSEEAHKAWEAKPGTGWKRKEKLA